MSLLLSMETLSICQQEADIMSNAQTTAFFLRIANGLRRVAEFGPKHNLWRKKTPSSPIVKQIAPIMIPMTPFHLPA